MTRYVSTLFIISILVLVSGCGDSKIRELRGEFMEGCKSVGSKRAVCSCTFDKIEGKYTKDQLLDMKIGVIPNGFPDFSAQATLICIREN